MSVSGSQLRSLRAECCKFLKNKFVDGEKFIDFSLNSVNEA